MQYQRVTMGKLRDALDRARTKLTASQKRYKNNFDKKIRFRPVVMAGEFVYVDRPPRPLISAELRARAQDSSGTEDLSIMLLPKTEGPFHVRSATHTTVLMEQDGVENGVGIDHVTKMSRGPGDIVTPASPTETEV